MDYRLGLYEKAMPSGMTWAEMLAAAKAAGFDQLEISIDESDARQARLDWTEEEFEALRRAMRETGVPILTMCLSGHRKWPLGSHDEQTRAQGMQIMQKAIRFAAKLGIRIIQLAGYDVYYEEGDAQTRAWFAENLHRSVEYAAKYGVNLGFETMETAFMDTVGKAMAHVARENSPYLGVYPDLGNLNNAALLYGHDILEDIRSGAGHLFAMHLKETQPGQYRDMEFGEGVVDFATGAQTACDLGVRLFTAEFWHDGRAEWRERLAKTNLFLRGYLDNCR